MYPFNETVRLPYQVSLINIFQPVVQLRLRPTSVCESRFLKFTFQTADHDVLLTHLLFEIVEVLVYFLVFGP
jgi:hypothetical protein